MPLYQSHGVASKSFIDLAGAAAEGVRLPAAALLVGDKLPDSDPQKKVVVDYKKTYEDTAKQPVSTFGGHAYDGLFILVDAMKRANVDGSEEDPRRNRKDQGLRRHRRHRDDVADRPSRPRSHGVPHAGDQGRRLDAGCARKLISSRASSRTRRPRSARCLHAPGLTCENDVARHRSRAKRTVERSTCPNSSSSSFPA